MPCNCDHMYANGLEMYASQVACFLDELDGSQWDERWHNGYHPRVYGKITRDEANRMTAELCSRLQAVDVTLYSLELQIWWRDHQRADRERVEQELAEKKEAAEREVALAKLTPYERGLLGIYRKDNNR